MSLYDSYISVRENGGDETSFFYKLLQRGQHARFHEEYKRRTDPKTAGPKVYYYMLTFTLDPRLAERVGGFSESYYDRVERYIKKLALNKGWNLLFFAYVREGGDEQHKHVHWHVSIKTSKYFDFKRNLSYYAKLYGHVDKSKSKLSTNVYAKQYMSKQSQPIVLLGSWDISSRPQEPPSQILSIEWIRST